jgi:hypothetical protein
MRGVIIGKVKKVGEPIVSSFCKLRHLATEFEDAEAVCHIALHNDDAKRQSLAAGYVCDESKSQLYIELFSEAIVQTVRSALGSLR